MFLQVDQVAEGAVTIGTPEGRAVGSGGGCWWPESFVLGSAPRGGQRCVLQDPDNAQDV